MMGDGDMAKKRTTRRRLRSCGNNGGLGILPCEGDWPATVTLKVDPAFICADSDTLHLCWECAEAFIEHARGFDVGVEIVGEPRW
jgi:hypothetical protein